MQAQKMDAIGQLAGGVAHDFNNILTAIIGYGSILQKKMTPDDPLRNNVDQIIVSAGRAAQLTRSLLAFSRKHILNMKPTHLNGIIASQEQFLRRIIGEDIELKSILRGDAVIMADSGQIEQVLMNLATNARDAMPAGGHLTIETDLVEMTDAFINAHGFGEQGTYAVVSVTDTGIGMDEEAKKKIFEPFFTTKEVGRGTGLGMAIVYGIVKQHKGFIIVYSQVGSGTTFKIYLPLHGEQVEQLAMFAASPVTGMNYIACEDDASCGPSEMF
jgi:signal transduction histidine kinase